MAFKKKVAVRPTAMVVGLGNPGSEYRNTRHNLGFMVVDEVAHRLNSRVGDRDSDALVGSVRHPGQPGGAVLLVKPQTFMNLSGRAVSRLLKKYHLGPEDLWVVYDELDLPFGKLRIREGGGAGGHNGVFSLIQDLGTQDFVRFRVGIGREGPGDPIDYLLSDFNPEQMAAIPEIVKISADAVVDGLREGLPVSMNRHNGRGL
jgi:PTH1 family peptidyl-tRNA hydrolase